MNDSELLIENQFKKLPPTNQQALLKVPWRELSQKIAKNNNLTSEQSESLETEVLLLLYQLQSADDFFDNLLREVGAEEEVIQKIFTAVETEIIYAIETEMEKIEPEKSSSETSGVTDTKDEWKRPELASLPNYSDYQEGKDPYREPLE